jgi:lanosterol synthase
VNHLLNILALYAEDPDHPELERALATMERWQWCDDAEGIRFAGAKSNAWDTAFAMRAALEAPKAARPTRALTRAHAYGHSE